MTTTARDVTATEALTHPEAMHLQEEELERTLVEMRQLAADETVLAVMPRMAQVWARKPAPQAQGAVVPQVARAS